MLDSCDYGRWQLVAHFGRAHVVVAHTVNVLEVVHQLILRGQVCVRVRVCAPFVCELRR